MPPLHRYIKSRGPAPVIWLDVDDTLVDFAGAHPAGVRAVEHWARTHVGANHAERFAATFERGFQISRSLLYQDLKPADQAYQSNVEQRLARISADGPRPSRWAREMWLEMAAEECGVKLAPEVLAGAAAEYWRELTGAQKLFDGVLDTLRELHARGYRMALVTSSDSRLTPVGGGWRYDPHASLDLKEQRLHKVTHPLLAFAERLVIGDPYEKTVPEFYEKVLREVPLEAGGMVITVGDSLEPDIRLARRAATAVTYGVLCDPKRRHLDALPEGVDARVEHLYELLLHFF
jgi:FMN phosphatase YigB (HAD superfamily)